MHSFRSLLATLPDQGASLDSWRSTIVGAAPNAERDGRGSLMDRGAFGLALWPRHRPGSAGSQPVGLKVAVDEQSVSRQNVTDQVDAEFLRY